MAHDPYSYLPPPIPEHQELLAEALGNVALWPSDTTGNFQYCVLAIDGTSRFSRLARSIELEAFSKFFGNDAQLMAQEYGPYETFSVFLVLVDLTSPDIAGVMRIIRPGPNGLKSLNDLALGRCTKNEKPVTSLTVDQLAKLGGPDVDETLDIATIAIRRNFSSSSTGNHLALASLMRGAYDFARDGAYGQVVAIIDSKPLEIIQSAGIPIDFGGGAVERDFEYLGAIRNSFISIDVARLESNTQHEVFELIFGSGYISDVTRVVLTIQ